MHVLIGLSSSPLLQSSFNCRRTTREGTRDFRGYRYGCAGDATEVSVFPPESARSHRSVRHSPEWARHTAEVGTMPPESRATPPGFARHSRVVRCSARVGAKTGCARHAVRHVTSMLCTKCGKKRGKTKRRSRSNQRRRAVERSQSAGDSILQISGSLY